MRLGKTRTERLRLQEEQTSYHRWFAWYPVKPDDEPEGRWVWLETVWRRRETNIYYRLPFSYWAHRLQKDH